GGLHRHLAAVEQQHVDAAVVQLERGGGAGDPGADHDDRHQSRKPSGNGSFGSSRYSPMPVIQARPVTSGTTAGRPATVVSATRRPTKRVPRIDSLTNGCSR